MSRPKNKTNHPTVRSSEQFDENKRFHQQFTGESTFLPKVIDSLRYMVIPVNAPPHRFKKEMEKNYPGLHQILRGWGYSTNDIFPLIRERLKCLAEQNLHRISTQDIDTMRNQILPTRLNLIRLAADRNVSPIDLGYLLAGWEYVDCLLQSIAEPTLPSEPPWSDPWSASDSAQGAAADSAAESPHERAQRIGWAKATVAAKDDDYLSGYRCRSRSVDTEDHRINRVGREGETDVLGKFRSIGLDFQTEQDLQLLGYDCTPDALLRTPIRFGEGASSASANPTSTDVFWIDVKTRVLIPGLSAPSDVMKVVRQIVRYTAEYGSGCIVWAKNRLFYSAGWDELIRKQMAETDMPNSEQCRVFHVGISDPIQNPIQNRVRNLSSRVSNSVSNRAALTAATTTTTDTQNVQNNKNEMPANDTANDTTSGVVIDTSVDASIGTPIGTPSRTPSRSLIGTTPNRTPIRTPSRSSIGTTPNRTPNRTPDRTPIRSSIRSSPMTTIVEDPSGEASGETPLCRSESERASSQGSSNGTSKQSNTSKRQFIQVLLFEHFKNDTELFDVLGEKYIRELSNSWADEFSTNDDPLTPSDLLLLLSDSGETRFRTVQCLYQGHLGTSDGSDFLNDCPTVSGGDDSADVIADVFSFRFGRPEPEPSFDPKDFF